MDTYSIILFSSFCINLILILTMIFVERRKPQSIFTWFVILTILPIFGFVLYMLFGGGLSFRTRMLIKNKRLYTADYLKFIGWQSISFSKLKEERVKYQYASDLIKFVKNCDQSMFSTGNKVDVFLSGEEKMQALKKDLLAAEHSINMLYYIFADDHIGKEIMDILINKAKQGIKVKLMYDSIGCLGTPRRFFKKLKRAGGEIAEFYPPLFYIRLINLKINYRNHRKVVVIDGKIAYTGGINVRDDHMGKRKKISPWRDTHIRVEGRAVWDLQNVFFNDWRYCTKDKLGAKRLVNQGYFNETPTETLGNIGVQVVTSGPDSESQKIEDVYIRMISMARNKIYIQTPYFIPDDTFMRSLIHAKMTGVDVKVMLPGKPDKRFVYFATLSYVKELLENGIEVYFYKGFLHSKTIVVDDLAVSIGTCNMDNRSFALNFELTTILYNKDFALKNQKIFKTDMANSKQMSLKYYNKKPIFSKMAQALFRLFSPLL